MLTPVHNDSYATEVYFRRARVTMNLSYKFQDKLSLKH
jgi:hypothetical protein